MQTQINNPHKSAEDARKSSAVRSLHTIAREIHDDWINVNYGAKPYLEAMAMGKDVTRDNIKQRKFYLDSYSSVVRYFLANAASWRGDKAKQIKNELKTWIN
jgi:hypothetical protein